MLIFSRRLFCLLVVLVGGWGLAAPALAHQLPATSEQLKSFQASYTINQDTSVTVNETLVHYTPEAKHGIFRYLPEDYDNRAHAPITWQAVTDSAGKSVPVDFSHRGSNSIAQIGDPDRTYTGERTYRLSYQAASAVQKQPTGEIELYWDVVGEDWPFPVGGIQVEINSPHAPIQSGQCWSGIHGGNDGKCQIITMGNRATITYPDHLHQGENLTFSLIFSPTSQFVFPTPQEMFWRDHGLTMFLLAIAVGVVAFVVTIGLIVKRLHADEIFVNDAQLTPNPTGEVRKKPWFYRRPQMFWYEPFTNVTPGEIGGLLKLSLADQIVAEIIVLAERKYLKIEVLEPAEKKSFLGIAKKSNYRFTMLKKPDDKLAPFQQLIMTAMFTSKAATDKITLQFLTSLKNESELKSAIANLPDKQTVTLEEIKTTFFTQMRSFSTYVDASLRAKKFLFEASSNQRMGNIVGSVFLVGIISSAVAAVIVSEQVAAVIFFIMFVLVVVLALWFQLLMSHRRTALGSHYTNLAYGLQENLKLGKWRLEIQEKLLYIEKVLPFAIVLGVVDKLAADMKELGLDQELSSKNHLGSHLVAANLLTSDFVSSFSHDFNSVYASQTSSGSGGSGGGGSSGGGGGGGGGGSW